MIHIGVYKEYVGMYKIEFKYMISFNICKIIIMSVLITIVVIAFVALCIWYCIVPTSPPPPPPSLPPQPTRKRPTLQIGKVDQKRRCNACGTHNTIQGLRTLNLGCLPPTQEAERQRHYSPATFTCTSCGANQEVPNPRGMCYINNGPANTWEPDYLARLRDPP
jgi:hypothetical protein